MEGSEVLERMRARERWPRALALLERLSEIGARPDESRDERLRAGALILASVLITLLSFVWVFTYAAFGRYVSAAIPAAYQVMTLVGLVVLARTKAFGLFRTSQLVMFLVLPPLLQLSLGGFQASSGIVLWSMVTPLAALALLGTRRAMPWLVAFIAIVVALAVLDRVVSVSPADLPAGLRTGLFAMNIIGATLSAFAILGYFVHQRELAHAALEAERERSERLLLNVLPPQIAERLKRDEGVLADHYDAVTVLFADLVGFTAHTVEMPPDELVRLLDTIFTSFDAVTDAEGLEKIKTIGDAYMVVGGLPDPRPDHAQAVAQAALAMQREVAAIAAREDLGWLAIRVGIDTGPAVAGVIGRRKFIYDLWGDTVNTASRMESHGVPGQIQVTARTAEALRPSFVLEPRGTIEVKGKGPLETFFLIGPAAQSARPRIPR
ncbi:MAG: adenylate/guanylate cyclase domain-containing protein [Actinomycetota bacterium]